MSLFVVVPFLFLFAFAGAWYSETAGENRILSVITRKLSDLAYLAGWVLSGMLALQIGMFLFVRFPSLRFKAVAQIETASDYLASALVYVTIPSVLALAILLSAFITLHIAGVTPDRLNVERHRSRAILGLLAQLSAHRRRVGQLQLATLIVSCVSFSGTVAGTIRDIAAARLLWAESELTALEAMTEERVAALTLDAALIISHDTSFPLDRMPPLGRTELLILAESGFRDGASEERSTRSRTGLATERPARQNWRGDAGGLTARDLRATSEVLTEPLFASPKDRAEIERIDAETEIYRSIVKAAAGKALNPSRIPGLNAALVDVPLAEPIINAFASALRERFLTAVGDRQMLPLEALRGGRTQIVAHIQVLVARLSPKLAEALVQPDPELETEAKRLLVSLENAHSVRSTGGQDRLSEELRRRSLNRRYAEIKRRSMPIEDRLREMRQLAAKKYGPVWDARPFLGEFRFSERNQLLMNPEQMAALDERTRDAWQRFDLEVFVREGPASTRSTNLAGISVGGMLLSAFHILEEMNEYEARQLLNRIEKPESTRRPRPLLWDLFGRPNFQFDRTMSVMAERFPDRFGLVAGLRGDPRFRDLAKSYRNRVGGPRPKAPRGR